MFYILSLQLRSYVPIKKVRFFFFSFILWFLDFDEDFAMLLEENEVNDGRENQN